MHAAKPARGAALDLDRARRAADARDVVDLRRAASGLAHPVVQAVVPRCGGDQLLPDELLGDGAVVDRQQVGFRELHGGRQPCEMLHEAYVDDDRLEPPGDPRTEREPHVVHGLDRAHELRALQQPEGTLVGRRRRASAEPRVHQLVAYGAGDGDQYIVQDVDARAWLVLEEVVTVRSGDMSVHLEGVDYASTLGVGLHRRRHATHEEVVAKMREERAVARLADRLRALLDQICRHLVADAAQVLGEGHWVQPQVLDPAHGDGDAAQGELEQRTRDDDVQLRDVLEEVAQGDDGARAGLDLVEEEEVASRHDALAEDGLELRQDACCVELPFEEPMEVAAALEVDRAQVIGEAPSAEVAYRPGLADLPSAAATSIG